MKATTLSSTGFNSLDNLIGGFANGELVLIGGRPTAGVTQLLINIAIAFSKQASVFYFTPPYLRSGIANRITSSLSQISMDRFVQRDFTANDTARIAALHSSNALNRIHVHDPDSGSMFVLDALRQALIEEYKLNFIIIDDLQALCHSTLRIRFIQDLKRIAEDFGVTVILATELSRAIDTRKDKKPKLNDLPKNNLILEVSDKIILAHRPERCSNQVELIIAKNSNGNTGSVQLARDESFTNLVDVFPDHRQ